MKSKTPREKIAEQMLRFIDRGLLWGEEFKEEVKSEFPDFHAKYVEWLTEYRVWLAEEDRLDAELQSAMKILIEAAPDWKPIESE